MKKIGTLIILTSIALTALATDDPYTKAMKEGLQMLNEARGPQDFLAAANKFSRISDNEKDKWHPAYYASYAMTLVAAMEQDPSKKDANLDVAQDYLDRITNIEHNKSEALALQGFIYMIRIGVDPASRGQQYSGMSASSLQKAKSMDPENPRVMYLLAQLSYGTAQFFGSDTSEACNLNDQAIEKFRALEETDNNDPFAPKWGKNMAEQFKGQCSN